MKHTNVTTKSSAVSVCAQSTETILLSQVGPEFPWQVSGKQLFQVALNSVTLKSRFLCVRLEPFLFLQSAVELLIGEIVLKAPVCGVIRFQIQTKWRELDMCDGSCSVEMCRNI